MRAPIATVTCKVQLEPLAVLHIQPYWSDQTILSAFLDLHPDADPNGTRDLVELANDVTITRGHVVLPETLG